MATFLLICTNASASPTPPVINEPVATFSGDQSEGISSGVDFDCPPITALEINNLTSTVYPDTGNPGALIYYHGYNGNNGTGYPTTGTSGGHGTVGLDLSINIDVTDYIFMTHGENALGISAQSIGGDGGDGGDGWGIIIPPVLTPAYGGNGGWGRDGGQISLTGYANINTTGDYAHGIFALSQAGDGGDGGDAYGGVYNEGGDGGPGGNGNLVFLSTDGTVVTNGVGAQAIVAQSLGGQGGSGGAGGGLFGGGGPGSGSGAGGDIVLYNHAAMGTMQADSNGIYAQSMGGFAGGGGGGGGILFWGGSAASSGDGGGITVSNDGRIVTYGERSNCIIVQSIGGGGGNAGDTGALIYTLGGNGGAGGHGGAINLTNEGMLQTDGIDSVGIIAQSIGGGGGIGAGVGGLAAIGGDGADSSNGGTVAVQNTGAITTSKDNSEAIVAQSIGGGGGRARNSGGVGVVGGSGGGGGDGNTVGIINSARLQTSGNDSMGILAQSIGAGGGSGAGAGGLIAMGGNGDNTGNGSTVSVFNSGEITTNGQGAGSIIAQSIGGGGGINGGRGGSAYSILYSNGGTGGSGGNGDAVSVGNTGKLSTKNLDSSAIFAQSIGGGGGAGGGAFDVALDFAATYGGDSAYGGQGGEININSTTNALSTEGNMSHGIHAQSIGGGGGSGGNALTVIVGIEFSAGVTVGGMGGAGGDGGIVNIINESKVSTSGEHSHGLYAESIGGGGGSGGNAVSWTATIGGIEEIPGIGVSLNIGGMGGEGGHGQNVLVDNVGDIDTGNYRSYGIFAQSIGGGGGNGGNTLSGNLTFNSINTSLSLGGFGNKAGNAAMVEVDNEGTINTQGQYGYGILAQSVGGGGGTGGNATSISADVVNIKKLWEILVPSVNLDSTVGGGYGSGGGTGSEVHVTSTGPIETQGIFAHGIIAQSIGGGGGAAGDSFEIDIPIIPDPDDIVDYASSMALHDSITIGSQGGVGGNAGIVTVDNGNNITTGKDYSIGILAQSVGGGGGTNGSKISDVVGLIDFVNSNVVLNNAFYGRGNGSDINITHSNSRITTHGNFAHGILAQSVGGGGGFIAVSEDQMASSLNLNNAARGITTDNTGFGVAFAGSAGGSGLAGNIDIELSDAEIITTGTRSHGIFAQSITRQGNAGTISFVTGYALNISVSGADSDAILLQSIGDSGNGNINFTMFGGGTIQGGSGDGAAIHIIGGAVNSVSTAGIISALSGTAILAGDGDDFISNHDSGTINGNILLGGGSNTFHNHGTFNAGSIIDLNGGLMSNDGILSPGGPGIIEQTHVIGSLNHANSFWEDGILEMDVAGFTPGSYDNIDVTGQFGNLYGYGAGIIRFVFSPDLDVASLIAPRQSMAIDYLSVGSVEAWWDPMVFPINIVGGVDGFQYKVIKDATGLTYSLQVTNMIHCTTVNPAAGDFNCDDQVDLTDLVTLGENYNQPGNYTKGDTNDDGLVNLMDLVTLGEHYNTSVSLPEPASLALMLAGSLLAFRRR